MGFKDRLWLFLLCAAAVIGGTGPLERALHPKMPCPRCGRDVAEFAPECQRCGVRLHWVPQ